jgi:ACS family 4-hydroxyphenylacetate permease-like MFS transporter
METIARVPAPSPVAADDIVVGKVFRRLMWFIFILQIVSFIDRINIGFAGLSMNKDLGLTTAMFGLATTVFYAGYLVCEIPSNLILARYGAKMWIARIMISWGILSAATMFAVGPWSLYGFRLLVGIAEAGFGPGILLYLTYWFPHDYRARAVALFTLAIPTTIGFASALSGAILQLDGFLGLAGWRWLFLIEGLPAVFLGVAAYFYLPDGPAKASWLAEEEKAALRARLDRDRAIEGAGTADFGVLRQLASRNVIALSLANFCLVTSLNANATWTPLIVREFAAGASYAVTGMIAAVPALVAIPLMLLWSRSSDRRNERPWHIRLPMLIAATGWLLVASFPTPGVRFLGLIMVSVGGFCAVTVFWTLPSSMAILSPTARPAGIALISSVGIAGAASSPFIVGMLKDLSGSFTPGLFYVVATLAMSVIFVTIVAAHSRVPVSVEPPLRA